ncbi:hypothetical protein H6G94_21760 [Nostoc punctiforme FACHB-252]|uniref:Protein NO VEIN C-terminal domain-containing protein n=1 Tax=Nostoc punctiforme FACHB-252 TaxID=1357509 RepID=A0ABR8HDV1_NOSPU|nr:hypothetical protein [Nostoc punctiforme]MBD2613869.1 hypothetical protein [Nostoc punctiforme FACHB-252]
MDLAIRYLLHGQADKYNNEEKLYIISSSDSLWKKLAEKLLSIKNELWRLIDSTLATSIPESQFQQLGITPLTKDAVIDLLHELHKQPENSIAQLINIQLDDHERKEILNEVGKNYNNKDLWKALPLHKTVEGNLVPITDNTYVENEQPLLSLKHLPLQITLITKDVNILHLSDEEWIPQWNASAAMSILLAQPNLHNYTQLILQLLQSSPEVRQKYNDRLRELPWLRLSSGQPISPQHIVKYPNYLKDYEKSLVELHEGYYLPSDLATVKGNYTYIDKLYQQFTDENILLDILAKQPSLYQVIVTIIDHKLKNQQNPNFDTSTVQILQSTEWLITNNNIPAKPSQVLFLDELEPNIQNILNDVENTDWVTASQLNNEIIANQDVLKWLSHQLFIHGKDALKVVSEIISQFPQYYLGEFTKDEFTLETALEIFSGIPSHILPVWDLVNQIVKLRGKEFFQKHILPDILQPIPATQLINLLGWLSDNFLSTDTKSIELYNQYLTLAVNYQNFATDILPNILLLNNLGKWNSTQNLCVNIPNIAASHILDNTQEKIIKNYLVQVSQATQQQDDKQEDNIIDLNLEEYFQNWYYHVYSEAIGAFISLIAGNNEQLRRLAQAFLRNKNLDLVHHRLLGTIASRSFTIVESKGDTEQVPSLINGYSFIARKKEGKSESVFVNQLDPYTNKLVLSSIDISQYNKEELSNLLKESARDLIQNVYQVTEVNESLDSVWKSLTKSEQIDVPVARNVILRNVPFILKFLNVHRQDQQIQEILLELDKAISQLEEYRIYNQDFTSIDTNIYNLNQQLGDLLENNSSNQSISNIILQAVREKIKFYGYHFTNIPFEIFQNADDALVELETMSQGQLIPNDRQKFVIEIDHTKNTITIIYWGRPINCFTHPDYPLNDYRNKGFGQDLEKMLLFNYSDKDSEVTGKFGLGFKSVHLICREPYIISSRVAFKITAGLLPSILKGNSIDSVITYRDRLEKKLQQYNPNIFDGTVISLPIDSNLGISANDTTQEFEKLIGLLLIFARKIKKCYLVKDNQTIIDWNPQYLLGEPSIEVGEVVIAKFTTNAICLKLGNYGHFLMTIDEKENKLRASLPHDIPNIWVTAPTKEKLGLSFIINAAFQLNPGRSTVIETENNNTLIKQLGIELGKQLCILFKISENNWEYFREMLKIRIASIYDFWNLIWEELAVKILNQQSSLVREMLSGNKGMGYFLTQCPALPNGLSKDYQELVLPQNIQYIVEHSLKQQEIFNHVAQWQNIQNRFQKNNIIHGNEWDKFQQLISYSPVKEKFDAKPLTLLQILQWQLPNLQANIQRAEETGKLINRTTLDNIRKQNFSEYEQIKFWLSTVKFLSQDNKTYKTASNLLVTNNQEIPDISNLLSKFAPDNYLLNKDYKNTGLEFFYACRQDQANIQDATLTEWINMIAPDDQERHSAVQLYLQLIKKCGTLSPPLEQKLQPNYPLEAISQYEETSEPKTADVEDRKSSDGKGNVDWGPPGEKLAGLFYKQIYSGKEYELNENGGLYDYLLTKNGQKVKIIEVKTISSESIRLPEFEWNQLITENRFYELFIVHHSSGNVSRVIRILNVWETLKKALENIKLQYLTEEGTNIESLIGLQEDKQENIIILNWQRLIATYKTKSKDENIMIYSCKAKLIQAPKGEPEKAYAELYEEFRLPT